MAAMTVLCVVASSTVAMADNLVADGDGLTPLVSNATVAFGAVCQDADQAPAKNVLFAINKVGGGNVYANSVNVSVSPGIPSSSAVSATAAGTIGLQSNWTTITNNTLSASTASSTITLDPSGLPAGAFAATVPFDATGPKNGGGTLVRSVDVSVTATIQSCNTPPTLTLPTDITVEAESAAGAVVTYSVGADDEQDGPLSALCSPASGSVFPLDTTTVQCSVTDSAGAEATGTFDVTVQDTGAPVLALPGGVAAEATGPAGATVTFGGSASDQIDGDVPLNCTPASGNTFPLGTTTVECSATDAHDNTANGSFTVTVVDNTPPALTLPADIVGIEAMGPAGASVSYEASAEDLVDGNVPVVCTPASGNTFPLGTTTVECSATDAHDNTANGSFTVTVVDTTDPSITLVSRTASNGYGWNDGDVVVEWSCSDLVGVLHASIVVTVSDEDAGQEATGICEDTSGNTASDTQTGINIDKTAPTASASASPAANANGWNNTDVTVSFSGSDGLSGIDFCDAAVVLSSEGAGQSASGTCTDEAGNVSAQATASDINIDKTRPDVSLVGGPASDGSYYFGFVPAAPTCSASDGLSGLDGSCTVSGYSGAVGNHTVKADATDKAGNSAFDAASYEVKAWTLNGFYRPVDMGGVLNTVKGGSTVPLKFEVFAGATELTDTSVVKSFVQTRIACDTSAAIDEIEVTTTGGTSLRYDAVAGQFVQNWQTPRMAGACYRVTMTTEDGSSLAAFFKLK